MNAKLVQFNNGKWGVRHGWFFYTWQDFFHPRFRWHSSSEFFTDCQTSDESKARSYVAGTYRIVTD